MQSRLERAYLEITNVCGLSCSFCPGCGRERAMMPLDDFSLYLSKLRPFTDCFCLHVMGEPLLHPEKDAILSLCDAAEARIILTTNGVHLRKNADLLLRHNCLYKVQISLHSFEANGNSGVSCRYFDDCFDFARRASRAGIITILRLWNRGGEAPEENALNEKILERMKSELPGFWAENKRGFCIAQKLYLEYDERFIWPSKNGKVLSECGSCRALRDQIAVLVDGTVVPCCLDGQGEMPLGNLKTEDLSAILSSGAAQGMIDGFMKRGKFYQPFCRTCGYAGRFR